MFTSVFSAFKAENEPQEAIRVEVKIMDGYLQPEYKKFSVDPQITSFDVLRCLLAKAFEIKGEFIVSYLSRYDEAKHEYLSLLSDWDLDAAFLAASKPCLRLKVDLKPFQEGLSDWDVVGPIDIQKLDSRVGIDRAGLLGSITESLSEVGRRFSQVQRAIGLKTADSEQYRPRKAPMTDHEFRNFLDSEGCLVQPADLRVSVYQGGIEPSLRKVVWRHLLNVFPEGLTGKERLHYLQQKSRQYVRLRTEWQDKYNGGKGHCSEELKNIANMVKKDVLRTDRQQRFYAGSDDGKNVHMLFNILVTYAVTHPDVSYCQGMSDLASPLLYIQEDEGNAYICFCAVMNRVAENFKIDGQSMTMKFQHLTDLLKCQDPEYFMYLNREGADDLFYCYRWLLLECKREFPFEDALFMLETMWCTIPPDQPLDQLELTARNYDPESLNPNCTVSPLSGSRENVYCKIRALRKQASSNSLSPANISHTSPHCAAPGKGFTYDLSGPNDYSSVLRSSIPEDGESGMGGTNSNPLENGRHVLEENLTEIFTECVINHSESTVSFTTDKESTVEVLSHNSEELDSCSEEVRLENSTFCIGCDSKKSEYIDCGKSRFYISLQDDFSSQTLLEKKKDGKVNSPRSQTEAAIEDDYNGMPRGHDRENVIQHCSSVSESKKPILQYGESGCVGQEESYIGNQFGSEIDFVNVSERLGALSPPLVFGDGNPFLICLCVTLLVQQKEVIMKRRYDYNELAMHYDKMTRQHDILKVLHQAKIVYGEYLRAQKQTLENNTDPVSLGYGISI